ncbi:MAG TPA: fibronectin type III domain-containing protein, partial [Candidatus Paceibacterota bacterium]|nr:fibronectin type III domain-containing protein [Candidatus Paceibacterota bacterium]
SGNASVTFSVATPADTQAPTTPTNLSATAVSSSQINLSWTASTDNVGVTSYTIYRNGTQIGTSATNSYNDSGLSASTQYSYTVSASDAAGNTSSQSTSASAVTQMASGGGGGGGSGSLLTYGPDAYGTTWKPLRIGAGGWIVGMDIAPDGTKVIRTDTYGAYWWNGAQWVQLVTSASLPASDVQVGQGQGVYEIRIAPSNTSRFYMVYNGYVYRSDNHGTTWTRTAFAQQTSDTPNDNYRMNGEKMAVDPINPNVVYVGTVSNGVWVTTNGGNSWSQVTAIAKGGAGGMTGIQFDPTSGQTGGMTNTIYVGSWGNGVYVSTNAGASWTKTTGGPTNVENATVSSDGIYYAAGNSGFWSYSAGTWKEMTTDTNGQGTHSIAVDPVNPSRIIAGGAGGTLDVSTDKGVTWTGWIWGGAPATTRTATDIPWLAWTNEAYMSSGNMIFDPSASNKLYFAEGIGVWYTSYPTTGVTWQTGASWISQSLGIEQLVADEIISPPGGNVVVASWDRPLFTITNPDVFPSTHGPNNAKAIVQASAADWASSNPSYLVADMGAVSSYSTNGGQTWTKFASIPVSGEPGSIAAASPSDIVWAPATGGFYVSTNGGSSWTAPSGPTNSGWAYYLDRQVITADRVNIGTFYAYMNGDIWRSTDNGNTWTAVQTSFQGLYGGFNAKLRSVPGEAGNLFFSGGQQSPDSLTSPANEQFMRSTNGGQTWTAVPNVLEVIDFGFGKAAAGQSYPAIYIVGWVNKVYGVWESDDNANTWFQIGLWPTNSLDTIKSISGDMNQYGRVYVGFSGSGYAYGNTSGAGSSQSTGDTTAPSVPTGLSATAVSSSQINLTWTTSTDNVGVTGYNIYRNGTKVGTATTNSYSDTGLSAATNYSYTVSAYDAAGNTSAQSSSASATTQSAADTTPPTVTITAPSGTLASGTTQTTLSVTTNETATCAYATSAGQAFASMTTFTTTGGTSHSTTLTGLSDGSSYTYYVKCKDVSGNLSSDSSVSFSVAAASGGGSGGGGGGTGTVSFTPTANPPIQFLNFAGPPVTFSNVNIGTPAANRIVVVGVDNNSGNNDGGTTAVTIGGVSATKAVTSATGSDYASIWYATVPTGSTANIVVTTGSSGGIENMGILVGTITGSSSPTPVASGSHAAVYDAGDPQIVPTTGTVTVPTGGVAVVFGRAAYANGVTPIWSTNTIGDFSLGTTTWNTTIEMLAHSTATGAQSYSVSGSTNNAFAYGSFAGAVAVWGP